VAPLAVAAVVAVSTVCATVANTPSAQAVTGRRVCLYLRDAPARTIVELQGGGFGNPSTTRFVAVNSTDAQDCPKITDSTKKDYFSSTFGSYPADNPEPLTCDDFYRSTKIAGAFYPAKSDKDLNFSAGDPCAWMIGDAMYEFDAISAVGAKEFPTMVPKQGDFTVEQVGTIGTYTGS
jgi:hypothetical protein